MTLSTALLRGIGSAVKRSGGGLDDVHDLIDVWERLDRDWQPRVDAMRREAQTVSCCCVEGGEPRPDGRCEHCYGRVAA